MAADLPALYTALKNADAAGDTAGAQKLAAYIKSLPAATPAEDPNMAATGGGTLRPFGIDTHIPLPDSLFNGLAGVGKGMTDLARGAGERMGMVSPQEIDAARQQDAPLMSTTAGKVGDVAGNIAALAPTALIPGANTVAGGAAIGTLSGLLSPTGTGESVPKNVLQGAALGGGTNAALGVAPKLIKSLAAPFYQGGREGIVGDVLNRFGATGGMTPASTPGWQPTLAEATQSPGAAILQKGAGSLPDVGQALASRQVSNNAAAVSALDKLAGSTTDQKLAHAVRDYMAGPLYDQAAKEGIDPAMADAMRPQIDNLMQRPSMVNQVLPRVKQIFGENSVSLAQSGDVSGLQMTKQALDDIINKASNPASSIGQHELDALTQTRSDLVSTMQDLSPKLRQADTQYATFSRPINESATVQALRDKLIPSLMDNSPTATRLAPNSFATGMRNLDQNIPKMAQYSGATVDNTMSPGAMTTLNGIQSDLARRATSDDLASLARGGNSGTAQNLATQNVLRQVLGPMGLPQSWAEAAARSSLGRTAMQIPSLAIKPAEDATQQVLGRAILDPQYAASLAAKAGKPLSPNIQKLISSLRYAPAVTQGIARSQ